MKRAIRVREAVSGSGRQMISFASIGVSVLRQAR
jgi:hypothetical protein